MTTIEGTIKYKITLDENGTNTEYESTLENDIAAMAISEFVCGEWIKHIKEERSNHTGKVKAQINDRLLKTMQAQKGLKTLGDYAFAMYKAFKGLEEMRASADVPEVNSEIKLEPINNTPELKKHEIWRTGFSIQGNSGEAELLSEEIAESWDAAVKLYMDKNPGKITIHETSNGNIYTDWGCTLYDNERDARKSFG